MVKVISRAGSVREPFRAGIARFPPAPGAHAVRFAEHDQFGAVGQGPDGPERDRFRAVLDPPGQVSAARRPDPAVHGEEAAVGEIRDSRPGNCLPAGLPGRSRRRGSRRPRRRSHRKVAVRTCAVTRSIGRAPTAGVPNSPSSTPFLPSSIVVPSIAVISGPSTAGRSPGPRPRRPRRARRSFSWPARRAASWPATMPRQSAPARPAAASGPAARTPSPARRRSQRRGTGTRPARDTTIFAVSTRSYLWPVGASRSARAITPSASRSSSRPCRPSSASHSVQNPGPDATRAAISAPAASPFSPCGTAGVDAGMMTMANLAGNKAPGERTGRRQPSSYQELCSISGTTGSRRPAVIGLQPDRDRPKTNTSPMSQTLGQWGVCQLNCGCYSM